MTALTGAARVFRERNSGLYMVGVTVSAFGTSAMDLAAGIWVKSLTGSSSLAALTSFCIWAPVLAGPLIGTVADRMPRRPLLIWVNIVMAVVLTTLLLVQSAATVWILFGVLVVYGVSLILMGAAEAALVPSFVAKDLLGDVNGLRLTANEGMKILAPLAGAGLFAQFGGPTVALTDAATFAIAAVLFAFMTVREPVRSPDGEKTKWLQETMEGISHLSREPGLRRLVLAGGVTMFLGGTNGAMIYAVVDDGLHQPPSFVGLLYALQGAGSILSGLAAGPIMRHTSERWFAAIGIATFAVGAAVRALPLQWAVLAGSVAIGLGLPAVLIAALTAVQRQTPDALIGRVAASANTVLYVPNAVALGAGAGIVAVVDYRLALAVIGVGAICAALYCLTAKQADGPTPAS